LFKRQFPKDFEGVEVIETLHLASKEYNIKFVIYNYIKETQNMNNIQSLMKAR
jgi:hypothetical protein